MIAAVIPARNGAPWLHEAVESVRAQGPVISEIVVVDDGSTDGTPEIASRERGVRLLRNAESLGPGAARNRGVDLTTAPLLTFLDVDDLWTPTAIAQRLALLREGPYDVVATRAFCRSMRHADREVPATGDGYWDFRFGTVLLTREAWDVIGPIEESLHHGEDMEWWIRAREAGLRVGRSDLVTLIARAHPDSWAATHASRMAGVFDVIRLRRSQR